MPALNIKGSLKDILLAVEGENYRAALAIIGKIFQDPTVKDQGSLADVITQLLVFVLAKSTVADRAAFSKTVSGSPNLPLGLIEQMMNQNHMISAPFIMTANLTDADLIQMIISGDLNRKLAITKRPNLTIPVTDQLTSDGELPVLVGLAKNVTAKLSRRSFELMAGVASVDADMDTALASRTDLPADIAAKMSRRMRAATEARMSKMIKDDLSLKRGPLILRGRGR